MDEYTLFYIFEEHSKEVITIMVCKNLRTIELQECMKGFVRVHKSYIVNTLHVYSHCFHYLMLNNLPDMKVPIGDKYRNNVIEFTEKWKIKKPVTIIIS